MNIPSLRLPGTAMTIGRQVLGGYLAVLVVILGLVLVAAAAVRTVSDAKDVVIDESSVLVSRAHELDAVVSEEAAIQRAFYLTRDERALTNELALEARFRDVLAEIATRVETAEGR